MGEVELHLVVGLEGELRNRFPLEEEASLETVFFVVVDVVVRICTRVGLGILNYVHIVASVLIPDWGPRQDAEHCSDRVGIIEVTHLAGIGIGVAEVDFGSCLEGVGKFHICVDAGCKPLIVHAVEYAFVLVI